MKLLAVTCVAVVVLAGRSVVAQEEEVLSQVRLADMWKVVEVFSKLDRTSSSAGEREAAEYLKAQLEHYGIRHRVHEVRSYLSVPVSASLQILSPCNFSVPSITPSFSGSTGSGGLSGELVYVGPEEPNIVTTRDEDFVDAHLEGKVALLRGYPSPRLLREAEASGAVGAVCIAPSPRLVNMIVSRVWGHPTQEEARQLTKIPVVTINETDGFRLEALGRDGRVSVRLEAEIDTGWKNIPLLVAEVPGTETPEQFVLIGNHLDAWYEGVTDSATGNASLLEVARVLHENRQRMRRSVRIAWWPGHSTGRYSGSTWYADAFFQDLYDNAVAYLAIDSPGVRSATAIEAEGMFEAKASWTRCSETRRVLNGGPRATSVTTMRLCGGLAYPRSPSIRRSRWDILIGRRTPAGRPMATGGTRKKTISRRRIRICSFGIPNSMSPSFGPSRRTSFSHSISRR